MGPGRRPAGRALLALAILSVEGVAAAAQTPGLPVYAGGFASGLEASAVVAFRGGESRMGDGTSFGAGAAFGFWRAGVAATVARLDQSGGGDGLWAYGFQASVKLIGGVLTPLAVYVVGGVGGADEDVDRQFIPLAVSGALTLPTPLLSVKPWIAPRLDIERTTFQGESDSNTVFGLSAGVDLTTITGVSFRVSYDQVKNLDSIVAVGAAYRF